MDFFENIDALLWRLAAILALVLVATLVVRLLLRADTEGQRAGGRYGAQWLFLRTAGREEGLSAL